MTRRFAVHTPGGFQTPIFFFFFDAPSDLPWYTLKFSGRQAKK
jgi:hypothetical protein